MKQKKILKVLLIMMLFLSVCIMKNSSTSVVNAAAKTTTLNKKSMTIPVGKINYQTYWNTDDAIFAIEQGWKLLMKNPAKGATYKFTSSNEKVVTIAEDGGYPTGLKAGKAVITCTQILDGKKTEVGKCTITVKKAKVIEGTVEYDLPVGTLTYTLQNYFVREDEIFFISYRNPKATYTFTSDSTNFSIKEVKWDAASASKLVKEDWQLEMLQGDIGDKYFYGYEYTAKKAGTYKVTVKETYNKKTTTIGTFTVKIVK